MKRLFLAGLAAAMASSALSQDVKVEKYTLPNGMTVILHEDHTVPMATVNIWYRVGSKDEPARKSGFAHLFEHLMFMGTQRVPNGQYDRIMEAGGGSNNASTAEDRTNYFDIGPSNLLPTLLWLEAERLEALGKNIDQKKLDLQRDVVKNERRQNTENTPYGRAYEALNGLMFPPSHPYGHSVIGSMSDLDNASVKDVQDFFATYYVPNNGSMVVSGDFKSAEIKPLIEKLFSTLPRQNDVPRNFTPDSKFKGVRKLTLVDKVQAPKLIMAWHSPAHYQVGDAELSLAGSVLSGGVSSRLYQRLVVKEKLASEVSAGQDARLLGSMFLIDVTANPDADLAKIQTIVDEELVKFEKEGPTAEELKRQATKLESGLIQSLQSIERTADQLNEFEFYFKEPNSYQRVLGMYRSATSKSVKEATAKTLDPNARLIIQVVPESAEAQGANPRDTRPGIADLGSFNPQAPEIFTLSNGLKVEYWNRPEVPLTQLNLQVKRGADLDPAEKLGLASLTGEMLSEGSGNLDTSQFEQQLDLLGADLGSSASTRNFGVSLAVLTRNFSKALGLFADAIKKPKFDAKEFERVQRIRLSNLEEEKDQPAAIATKVAKEAFYGSNHPFGRPADGTPETVKAIKPDDLKAEYQRFFQPQNATLFAAGSLPAAAFKAELEKQLFDWTNSGAALPAADYVQPPVGPSKLIIVDRPGAVQTNVRFYFPAPTLDDASRPAVEALSTVLGGSFTSRLNQNLREDKGYTYGANARLQTSPLVGALVSGAEVRADVTGASLKEFLIEFNRARKGDITETEAKTAAGIRRTSVINSLGTLGGLVGTAAGLDANGKPFTELSVELAKTASVTAAQVNAIAAKGLPLENAVIVLVGDKKQILAQIQGLGLPTPTEWTQK